MSPFHIACQKGNLEIVKTFLKIEDLQIDQPGNLVFFFSFFLFEISLIILKSTFVKQKEKDSFV